MQFNFFSTVAKAIPFRTLFHALAILPLAALCLAEDKPRPPIQVESIMERDPVVDLTIERFVFPPRLKELWLEALSRPEADLRREAAETIARAHRRGMEGLADTAPALIKLLKSDGESETTRLAVAQALVAIDAREAADELFAASQARGLPMTQIVEPALAAWEYTPARDHWRALVADNSAPRVRRRLAIECLAVLKDGASMAAMLEIVRDVKTPMDLRLAAARAAGALANPALFEDAKSFVGDGSTSSTADRLLGVLLLSQASGDDAKSLLEKLALDPEPAVAAVAWKRMLEIDPDAVVVIAPESLKNLDANVRRLAAEALVVRPTAERVSLLCPLLDDPHPEVRAYVRESLFDLASAKPDELQEPTIEGATAVLNEISVERWRGHEQAALLLAALDHKPATPRLVELLEAPRQEEFVTAAWALRILAVPETFPAMLDRAKRKKSEAGEDHINQQVSQIFQAFGQHKYAAGEPEMRGYVPKNPRLGVAARTAAVWAIGHLHAGKPDEELVKEFVSRLNEMLGQPPEMPAVRAMSAISLARMQDKTALDRLRYFQGLEGHGSLIGSSCSWALRELTGEPIPPTPIRDKVHSDWFLQPLGP